MAALCLLAWGCASIPEGKYGVSTIDVEGVRQVEDEALLACLATHERPGLSLNLGTNREPQCDVPPFDARRTPLRFWTWPWTDWPVYDEAIFERDLDRIERWYRARGYYDARVVSTDVARDEEEREVEIVVRVSEGDPVLVERIELEGLGGLSDELRTRARQAVRLRVKERFDEAVYDASKQAVVYALSDASHAKARVEGRVLVNTEKRSAVVLLRVEPGPRCRFGRVRVEGNRHLEVEPVIEASGIESGELYSESRLKDAQEAIYGLGAFASVELTPEPRVDADLVDVLIRVVPARRLRFGVGAGVEANLRPGVGEESMYQDESLSQWDVHLLFRVEHRDFFGGMRRMRIEERPRLIFDDSFPGTGQGPEPGNLLRAELRQPAFFEPRTMLTTASEWDYGPDPYGGGFSRHDFDTWVGPGRYFFRRKLYLSTTAHFNLFVLRESDRLLDTGENPPEDYYVTFLQHSVRVDLRDNPRKPRLGSFFALTLQHSGYFLPSNWDYLRVTPEVRGYLPLPLGMVLAGRVRFGVLAITGSKFETGTDYGDYGPSRYRLRGGGPNSVRGFSPNTLGDVQQETTADGRTVLVSGGLRQWEASAELRIPLLVDFGTVLFVDAGDVTVDETFRFDHPQTTIGFGFRYDTIVGPLRFDVGFLPSGLQVIGKDQRPSNRPSQEGGVFGLADGAFHLTIGEAF